MRKFFAILGIAILFLAANLSFAQNCGKCPFKCAAKKTVSPVPVTDPEVYVKKGDEMYHQKDCTVAKEGYTATKLSEAVKSQLKPCLECNPPVLPAAPTAPTSPTPPTPPTPPTAPVEKTDKEPIKKS